MGRAFVLGNVGCLFFQIDGTQIVPLMLIGQLALQSLGKPACRSAASCQQVRSRLGLRSALRLFHPRSKKAFVFFACRQVHAFNLMSVYKV